MRIAFMGTPDFAAHILNALIEGFYRPVAVYTQPPRPCGRGYKLTPSPVQTLAIAQDIPVFTPVSLKTEDVQDQWRSLNLDIAVVVAYGLLLPPPILEAPRLGCVNVHASLLPRWRGAAPIQRALLAGDKKTGISLMKMDAGLDTGPLLLTEEVPLDASLTTACLFKSLAELGAKTLLKALPLYAAGKLKPVPQPTEGVSYADKIMKEEGKINWTLPASLLDRQIRALNPRPGTWFYIGEDRLKILEALPLAETFPYPPGTVLEGFKVVCGEGALQILRVQKEGKAPLSTEDFLKGYTLPPRLINAAL